MEGRRKNEGKGAPQPAACKDRLGRLWFATAKGVAVIDPTNIKLNNLPPPVIIDKVIVDGQQLDLSKEIALAPGKERVEFRYVGLSFIAPQKVKFKYMLEGFDKDWLEADNSRNAYYTNIPPRHYQ